jgi:hypothetical protein
MQDINITEIEQTALSWPERAKTTTVTDANSYVGAAGLLKTIAQLKKQIKDYNAPIKSKAKAALQAVVDAEKNLLEPLETAEGIIKAAIAKYDIEQKRLQFEAAERDRKREEEKRLAIAVEAEQSGQTLEAVREILNTPVASTKTIIPQAKVEGVFTRETWGAEVTDLRALCEAIAKGNASIESVLPNMPFLNDRARTYKDKLDIPGVKAIKKTSVTART